MSPEQAAALLESYLSGTCSPAEQELVEQWYYQLKATGRWEWPTGEKERVGDLMEQKLLEYVESTTSITMNPRFGRNRKWWMAAAVLLLLCGAGCWWFTQVHQNNTERSVAVNILPGTDKAVLTLADGKQIVLDSSRNGTIAQEKGVTVNKVNKGLLAYKGADGGSNGYNTLTVPRGGQFQVVLPDGSHVWLNSASSLRYPTTFTSSVREVELTGEGYFEISPDATKPFVLKSGRLEVEVLGTGFNVMAYSDEPAVKVTLVQGAVIVGKEITKKKIKPGEQAVLYNGTEGVSISTPDMKEVLAWKDGEFRFNGTDITSIMRQVARWYDVEIEYSGVIPGNKFGGVIPKKSEVTELLSVLEATKKVHFEQEGKKIIVTAGPR